MTTVLRNVRNGTAKAGRGQKRGGISEAVLLALDQRPAGAQLRELARVLTTRDSSVQYAVRKLVDEGIVERRQGRYVLTLHEDLRAGVLFISARRLGLVRTVAVLAQANRAVEFAALGAASAVLHLVYTLSAEPAEVVRFQRRISELMPQVKTVECDREELGRATVEAIERTAAIRRRLRRSTIVKGRLELSFPDRSRRGASRRPTALGKLHPALPRPSRRARQRIAARYGLAEISVFGSATRTDFRPDSDVDVLVRFRPGLRPSFRHLADLRRDLEKLFGRRVDVLTASGLDEELRPVSEREKVRLYGWRQSGRVAPQTGKALRSAGARRSESSTE